MQLITTIAAMRTARAAFTDVGFVPTMGYLHEGHLHLVRRAAAESAAVAVSIFVNPTQFGPREDFARYPRNLERDLAMLNDAGVDFIFVPAVEEIYPPGFGSYVTVPAADELLEGAARPGHFRGVATVVCKLLNIVQPTRAYFGRKDAQQVAVVQQMVRDLNMPTTIVVVPTVREPDGLAMSSRNSYLSPEQRTIAPTVYQALLAVQACFQTGERNATLLRGAALTLLEHAPAISIEYVSIADPLSLRELETVGSAGALVSLAVRLGGVRLIDNISLTE